MMLRRLPGLLLAAALPAAAWLSALPALAGSALAAWRINSEGVLELRTPPGARLQAFFEDGKGALGPRVWIDLPGAPQRSRSIPGNGEIGRAHV